MYRASHKFIARLIKYITSNTFYIWSGVCVCVFWVSHTIYEPFPTLLTDNFRWVVNKIWNLNTEIGTEFLRAIVCYCLHSGDTYEFGRSDRIYWIRTTWLKKKKQSTENTSQIKMRTKVLARRDYNEHKEGERERKSRENGYTRKDRKTKCDE